MSQDDRVSFIANTICSICQINASNSSIIDDSNKSNDVIDFLDDSK